MWSVSQFFSESFMCCLRFLWRKKQAQAAAVESKSTPATGVLPASQQNPIVVANVVKQNEAGDIRKTSLEITAPGSEKEGKPSSRNSKVPSPSKAADGNKKSFRKADVASVTPVAASNTHMAGRAIGVTPTTTTTHLTTRASTPAVKFIAPAEKLLSAREKLCSARQVSERKGNNNDGVAVQTASAPRSKHKKNHADHTPRTARERVQINQQNDDSAQKMSSENTLKEVPKYMPELVLHRHLSGVIDPIFTNEQLL